MPDMSFFKYLLLLDILLFICLIAIKAFLRCFHIALQEEKQWCNRFYTAMANTSPSNPADLRRSACATTTSKGVGGPPTCGPPARGATTSQGQGGAGPHGAKSSQGVVGPPLKETTRKKRSKKLSSWFDGYDNVDPSIQKPPPETITTMPSLVALRPSSKSYLPLQRKVTNTCS